MISYKNYIVHSSETISDIATRELGYENALRDLISINKLRYPYISDNPRYLFGKELASFSLLESAEAGSSHIKIPISYVKSGEIPYAFLSPGNFVYFSSVSATGDITHDSVEIERYYTSQETMNDGSIVEEGTLEFATDSVAAPQFSMTKSGLVFLSKPGLNNWPNQYSLDTYVSNGVNTLLPTISGRYYFSYSYVAENGKETPPSPFDSFFETSSSSYKPEYINITNENISNGYQIIVKSPSIFPAGVKSIRLYIAYSDPSFYSPSSVPTLTFKKEFFSANEFLAISSITPGNNSVPTNINMAKIGLTYSYKIGSKIYFFESPDSLPSRVLKTGDVLKIPVLSSENYGLINTYANESSNSTFGTDIALNEYGYISFTGNSSRDILTVSGRKNVLQSLNNRLTTYIGQMSLQPDFGNGALSRIGSSYSQSLLSSVETLCANCVLSDPRVSKIKSISVSFNSESSAISVQNFSIELKDVGSVINLNPLAIKI